MGFPNVDKILQRMFFRKFLETQQDPQELIADLFSDFEPDELVAVTDYLQQKVFVTDIKDRDGSRVFIILSHVRTDVPFPQISITLGDENTDQWIGDQTGQSTAVTDSHGATIAWKVVKGFMTQGKWDITIAAATKLEIIWLTRLCQRFVMEGMQDLAAQGIISIDMNCSDMQPMTEQLPIDVLARRIKISATAENTWTARVPVQTYAEGVNQALTTLP